MKAEPGQGWREVFDSIDGVVRRFPKAASSEGAQTLAAATARIGIDTSRNRATPPDKAAEEAFEKIRKALSQFVAREVDAPEGAPEEAPTNVAAWFSARDEDVVTAGPVPFPD